MKKLLTAFLLITGINCAQAQTQKPVLGTQPYGHIDVADLELKSCDFEPDANAEVLFNKGEVYYESGIGVTVAQHIRIKILNDFGKSYGNVKISFPEDNMLLGVHNVYEVEGETFNLQGGKIETAKLDKKLIYTEKTNRSQQATVFTLPNVQAGSVIEYRYKWHIGYFPTWRFQSELPTRYSEVKLDLPAAMSGRYVIIPHVKQAFVKEEGKGTDLVQLRALSNVHSLPNENFIGARNENLQHLEVLAEATSLNSWEKIGDLILKVDPIGGQFSSQHLSDESELAKHAKQYKTTSEKIAFLFDTVKNRMKWNDETAFFSFTGVGHAWDNKSGSTAEINIALYLLLKRAGVKAYPMLAGTRDNTKVNPVNPSVLGFNNIVVYVPIDTSKFYILDASNRHNLYNVVPDRELNTFGLSIDPDDRKYEMVFMENEEPSTQSVDLSANVFASGKITGSAEINSDSYQKTVALNRYNTDGKEKYTTYLQGGDNRLKINNLRLDGMQTDTLPLVQKLNFDYEATAADGGYLYLNTNLFTLLGKNPFVNAERYSDIDFGHLENSLFSSVYKLPEGYKLAAAPQSVNMSLPDKSLIFKKIITQEDNTLSVRYVISRRKVRFSSETYPDIQMFYKKMYELMNEQVVLKKS